MKKLILLILLMPFVLNAQEIKANVSLTLDQLQTADKERLQGFDLLVEDYLNSNRFTGAEWDGDPIQCNIQIMFTGAAKQTDYSAQLIINSTRPIYNSPNSSLMLNLRDEKWQFVYEKGQSLLFNPNDFNSLTSLLDYYAYVIIGFDSDSYQSLGGNEFFQEAIDIAVYGGSSRFKNGWELDGSSYNRRALVEEIRSAKFLGMREDIFNYHYNGIDILGEPGQKAAAQKNMVTLIKNLAKNKDKIDPRSVFLKVWFNAKYKEIINSLKDYPDKEIWKLLKKIDPPHGGKYDEIFYDE